MGFLAVKTIRLNQSGFPDIIAMRDGYTCWIECKEEKDTIKPIQKLRIDQLLEQNIDAICVQKGKGIIYGKSKHLKKW